jgi:hypothetical protein
MGDIEGPPDTDVPLRALDQPEVGYCLRGEERARVQPWVDVERLEQLLAITPAVWRPWMSRGFLHPTSNSHSALSWCSDPRLQAALEAVYQGWWDAIPIEWREAALTDAATVAAIPGAERARVRWASIRSPAP